MKIIRIDQDEEPITVEDIKQFEKTFQIILPDNYKKLILKYNGGIIVDEHGNFLDTLYSMKYGEVTLEEGINDLQILENTIPREYFPFASTGTGQQITLYLKDGEYKGKIFLFRVDDLEPQLIADSLEELIGVKSIDEL